MDDEAEGKDRNHDIDEGRTHEVTSELEKAVSGGEEFVIIGDDAILSGEGVDDREEVDGPVQQKENDKESTTDALDEFLSDRRVEYEHFFRI